MLPFADEPAIETGSLPALVAAAGVGALIVIYRAAIVQWCRTALGSALVGRGFVIIGGYGWLLVGLCGIVLWVFDQL